MKTLIKIFALLVIGLVLGNQVNAQGPQSPEAGSFEPVDATDMVNLVTGDFSYVLPLLKVPSPEGGYPLALAYHAGIAMDQEASWTGLGWNLNAGAVNRSINGYPDDYKGTIIDYYSYDQGQTQTYQNFSLGFTSWTGYSVGMSLSFSDGKSIGGSINYGFGLPDANGGTIGINGGMGTNGKSIGVSFPSGLKIGVSADGSGTQFKSSIGLGRGFSIGTDGIAFGRGFKIFGPLGVSISTNKSSGFTLFSQSIGFSSSYDQSITSRNYTIESKTQGFRLPVPIPKVGMFSVGYSKQTVRYYLSQVSEHVVSGPLNFNDFNNFGYFECTYCISNCMTIGQQTATHIVDSYDHVHDSNLHNFHHHVQYIRYNENPHDYTSYMDVYEVPLKASDIADKTDLDENNIILPAYDNYSVSAQGLNGNISPSILENGLLFGKDYSNETTVNYRFPYINTSYGDKAFTSKPEFSFIDAYNSYLEVNQPNYQFWGQGVQFSPSYVKDIKARKKQGNFISYFTNDEILNDPNIYAKGYLRPDGSSITTSEIANSPSNSIGAFSITAPDGKSYHYSLPVYNHEVVSRSFGIPTNRHQESQSYFEKKQLTPYATHWLLTAVTGPDYIDTNSNGYPDNGDYGYWVKMEYGKWSDASLWKSPYGEDYYENGLEKTYTYGRKELYYLNKVKTRTHTALFVKSLRDDNYGHEWSYSAIPENFNDPDSNDYMSIFNLPKQGSLKLDKIVLVRNEDDNVNMSSGSGLPSTLNDQIKFNPFYYAGSGLGTKVEKQISYNLRDNILDYSDNIDLAIQNAIKVIDFSYDYALAKDTPNSTANGRLTLNAVHTKGRGDTYAIPPYNFTYYNNPSYSFDINDKDDWGYHKTNPEWWSLKEIQTPLGGKIIIDYEKKAFNSIYNHGVTKSVKGGGSGSSMPPPLPVLISDILFTWTFDLGDDAQYVSVGESVDIDFSGYFAVRHCEYEGTGYISNISGTNITIIADNLFNCEGQNPPNIGYTSTYHNFSVKFHYNSNFQFDGSGIRVAKISLNDEFNTSYKTAYRYQKDGISTGYVPYIPHAPEVDEELPYSSILPAPIPMYEYVEMVDLDNNDNEVSKTEYQFLVLKDKDNTSLKFQNFLEVEKNESEITVPNNIHGGDNTLNITEITLHDNLSAIGQLLGLKVFNSQNQLIKSTQNEYTFETINNIDDNGKQGITIESYISEKTVLTPNTTNGNVDYDRIFHYNRTSKKKYVSKLKKTETTENGFSSSIDFSLHDEITGLATETIVTNSTGQRFRTEIVPAYTILEYDTGIYSMGSKVDDITNKNMLTQEAMSKTYIDVTGNNDWELAGVGITTWNNEWKYRYYHGIGDDMPGHAREKIWRKHKTFVWDGEISADGTYLNFTTATDDGFNWGIGYFDANANFIEPVQTNPKWKNLSTTTLYDHYSTPLEVKDINSSAVATKMGDAGSKVIAFANSQYNEMFYSGAEYLHPTDALYHDGEVYSLGQRSTVKYHTGRYSVATSVNRKGFGAKLFANEHRAGKYKVSVWVEKAGEANARIHINGSTKPFNGEKILAGDWVQMNHYEDLSVNDEEIYVTSASGTVHFDDFRIHPVSSSMTSYVYNQWDELEAILGPNNLATKFEYDSQGRLVRTYSEMIDTPQIPGGFKISTENDYHYKYQD